METIFDFMTVATFLVIVGLYFHYSGKKEQDFIGYLWPAIGCALTNHFGNKGFIIPAMAIFALVILYIYVYIVKRGGIVDKYNEK